MTKSELQQYRQDNPDCELWPYFATERGEKQYPRSFNGPMVSSFRRRPAAQELHHIFHGTSRIDHTSNVIHLCREIHRDWGHDCEPKCLAVMCLYHKRAKRELDWSVLNEIAGRHVLGWLETSDVIRACSISDGLERMRVKLTEVK